MGNKLAVTANGEHKLGKLGFLTVNGIHRKVKSAYLTVGGKHEKCYSSGVVWNKYNAVLVGKGYVESSEYPGENHWQEAVWGAYSSYYFDAADGYVGYGDPEDAWRDDDYVGWYYVESYEENGMMISRAWVIGSYVDGEYYLELVGEATSEKSYAKGSTYYGEVTADKGEYPETGYVQDGDTSSWCVIEVSGNYYYYERA